MSLFSSCSEPVYDPSGHHEPPGLIAHRGASSVAPENSIPAIEKAWELGADAAEVDVRISKDERLVVIHDRSTKRTTGKNKVVAKTPFAELKELDAGSWFDPEFKGTQIPSLDEVMDHVPAHKELMIEFKTGPEGIDLLERVLNKRESIPAFSIISFDRQVVAKGKKRFPEIPAHWVLASASSVSPTICRAKEVDVNGLNVRHENFGSGEKAEEIREEGLHLLSWTVNDPERAVELRRMGVQGILTDEVQNVRERLDGMKKE